MSDVYQNAVLAIATSCSAGGTDGFLKRKFNMITGTAYLPNELPGQPPDSIGFKRSLPHEELFNVKNEFNDSLTNRAWAFQERLLTCRMVRFSNCELQWECNTLEQCECGSRIDVYNPSYFIHPYYTQDWVQPSNQQSGLSYTAELYNQWTIHIVARYTTMLLTHPRDKLPALSGVASRFSRAVNDEYIAGLWKKDILKQLLWSSDGGDEYKAPPQEYHGPSFSWASVGCVSYVKINQSLWSAPRCQWKTTLVSASYVLEGEDSFGRVVDGKVVLTGQSYKP